MDTENIVKKVCKELQITQRELAEIIKVNPGTPAQWVTKGEVPSTYQYLLELMLENIEMKAKLETIKKAHEIITKL